MIDALHSGRAKYSSIFNYPTLTWADVGVIGWLVDGAAIMNQIPLCRCSYGPYARAMIRICKEESFHQRQGFDALLAMMRGTDAQREMVQDAVNRWWFPVLMMFGPRRRIAQQRADHGLGYQAYFQRRPAPEVRRCHRRAGQGAGRDPARPGLTAKRARGHYDYSPLDWDEFWRVVNGEGPATASGWPRASRRTRMAPGSAKRRWRMRPNRHSATLRRRARPPEPHTRMETTMTQRNGRCGKSSSAASRVWNTSIAAACMPPTRSRRCTWRATSTRRQEGVSIWVVPSAAITASAPEEKPELFDPMADKIYRHPTFYQLPAEVNHM